MKVLFLYSEVMSYTSATLRELSARGVEVVVVSWDKNKLTPYQAPSNQAITNYKRSKLSTQEIVQLAKEFNPDVTVVSGWQDPAYLVAAFTLRLRRKKVVSGFDGQRSSSWKHLLGAFLGCLGVFKLFFSHAWIPGARQYEFAAMLGYRKSDVIFDLYSCDTELFKSHVASPSGLRSIPHKFIFVGRLEHSKGIDYLLDAWSNLGTRRRDWTLSIIGSGSMESRIQEHLNSLNLIQFLEPPELADQFRSHGCLILPSRFEPWGVVVHEAACTGLPLLLSDQVGASSALLIAGFNGYSFKSGSVEAIEEAMIKIIESSDTDLMDMGVASEALSRRISPETSASNLVSLA